MTGIKDLLDGERGIFGLLLVIAATVFVCLGQITFDQWQDFAWKVFAVFAAGKTVTTVAGLIKPPAAAPEVSKP